jgi:membrane associated rhomboid family serine protease
MASGPDLFVICKSCGSEVSPYITECPYCGTRLRKRAPKLERGGVPKPPRAARVRPSLGRLRPGEIPGIRGEVRPYVAWGLVILPVLLTLVTRTGLLSVLDVGLIGSVRDEPWRVLSTLFVYTQTGYEIVAVAASGLFAWLLERRHGPWAPLLVFLLAGAGGMAVVALLEEAPIALGANGAALGLLAAWAVRDLLGRRRGREDESDLLGVLAIAAVLVLLPLASEEAHALAGLVGGAVGLVLGWALARLPER